MQAESLFVPFPQNMRARGVCPSKRTFDLFRLQSFQAVKFLGQTNLLLSKQDATRNVLDGGKRKPALVSMEAVEAKCGLASCKSQLL